MLFPKIFILSMKSNRLAKLLPESLKKRAIVAGSALDEDMFQAIKE